MSFQYDQYLAKHKENVKKCFDWIRDNLPDLVKDIPNLEWQTGFAHDRSKSEEDEYAAYDAYFYGGNRSFAVVQAYRKAWLLHLHRNPHHWQYWILINDDPEEGEILIEMPDNYILEMICDWWAFSWAKGDLLEMFKWYDERKDYIKLHPNTRKKVDDILGKIWDKLGESSELYHHGVKGQKWGVRNGPPYPIEDKKVEKSEKGGIVRKTVEGHNSIDPRGTPNSTMDHIGRNGKVDKRAFYDQDGWKKMEIHTSDHGNPKKHPYGEHGEHIHHYEWDRETGRQTGDKSSDIPLSIRKENDDIL